jgi:protein-disulfide isomerase
MAEILFANQDKISKDYIIQAAEEIGIPDLDRFKQELEDGTYTADVDADAAAADSLGVSSTPTFFVNGILVKGAQPFSEFQAAIEAALTQ